MQAFTLRTAAQLARLVVRLSCAALCSAHAVVAAQANEEAGIDDAGFDDAGFAAAPVGTGATPSAPEEPSSFRYAARLGLRGVMRLETDVPSRVASLRQTVDARVEWSKHLGSLHLRALASVHTEADFAYLADLQAYDPETIDTYAWQVRSGETYVSAAWPVVQVSTGLQIVNLGQGEMLSVLDVANPRDLREPLVTDAGDLRLPVLMTRMSLNFSRVRLEAIVIHEANFGLLAPPLGEFSPFRRLLLQNDSIGSALEDRSLRTRHSPDLDLGDIEATQAIGRFGVSLGSLDLAVLGGSVLDGLGVPHLPDPEAFDSDTIDFPMTHPRYSMVGHSGAWTFGAFVLRWEASLDFDRAITLRKTDTALQIWSAERHDVLRGLVGVTYVPSTVTSAAIEVTSAYLFDNPARDPERAVAPRFPVEQTDVALRFNQRFLSERAAFGALLMVFGVAPVNAWAARLDLAYAITDDFEVMLGVATYHPSNEFGFFYGFDRNDRVFLSLRWDVSG